MPDHDPTPPDEGASRTDPAMNRAERRAARRGAGPRTGTPHGDGKVRGSGVDHAPDPRRYVARRRG